MDAETLKNIVKESKIESLHISKLFGVTRRALNYWRNNIYNISPKSEEKIKFVVPEYTFYYNKIIKELKLFDEEMEEDIPKHFYYKRYQQSNRNKNKKRKI